MKVGYNMRYQLRIKYNDFVVAPFVKRDAFMAVLEALQKHGTQINEEAVENEDCVEFIAEDNGHAFVVGWIYGK